MEKTEQTREQAGNAGVLARKKAINPAANAPTPFYYDFNAWMNQHWPGKAIQKIAIDAGFTCPNRDGNLAHGGCIFCSNEAFTPSYCNPSLSVAEQIKAGKKFFSKKHRGNVSYLVYFQSFTSTYSSLSKLQKIYEEALLQPDVLGIVIGTRPDCVSMELFRYLENLARHTFVMLEFGIESCLDRTLKLINRGHDFAATQRAFDTAAEHHLHTGGHFIAGLPGESVDDVLSQASTLSLLPIEVLKIHHLQVIQSTPLATEYLSSGNNRELTCYHFDLNEYIALMAGFIARIRPSIAIDRFVSQSPARLLLAPKWGLKPQAFNAMLNEYMATHQLRQGLYWQ